MNPSYNYASFLFASIEICENLVKNLFKNFKGTLPIELDCIISSIFFVPSSSYLYGSKWDCEIR